MIDFTFTAHVIPHTHWDRAWYLPFERFLAGLPALFDSIFAFLAIPEKTALSARRAYDHPRRLPRAQAL